MPRSILTSGSCIPGLARMYSAQGKFDDAAKEMKLALAAAPANQKVYLDGLVKRLEAKQDINQ